MCHSIRCLTRSNRCRSIGIDDDGATRNATHVTVAGTEKAPDTDGDRDMVVAVTENKKADEKNDDQPTANTKTEQASNNKDASKPADTVNGDKNDDGPVHINGVHYVNSNNNLHTVPAAATRPSSIVHSKKRRAVFRVWPRGPKGKVFFWYEANFMPGGKVAPNGIRSWGATLYDFYSIKPIPSEPGIITYLSGSRIAAAMRENGEVEHCKDELEWADNEEGPCEIPVAGTGELIECYEARTPLFGVYSAVEEVRVAAIAAAAKKDEDNDEEDEEHADNNKEDEDNNEDEEDADNDEEDEEDGKTGTDKAEKPDYGISSVLMPDRPLSSPFHPSHYPPPWPFIPFANPYPPVLLQERIPMHLLPETLYVHDPYSLLNTDQCRDRSDDKTSWINMRPRVYLYKLSFGSSMLKAVEESKKTAEESVRKNKRVLDVFRFMPTEDGCARGEPAYEVALPTKPSAPTRVEEAHLYLSPVEKLGKGHHSIVYKAEWKLPRDLFTEPKLCQSCVSEELQKEVRKLKRSGRWREMMRQAGREVPPTAEEEEEGGPEEPEDDMFVSPDPNEEFDSERITVLGPQSKSGQKQTTPSSSTSSDQIPVLRVYCPNLRWQSPSDPSTKCSHFVFRESPVPRTSVFQVAAKLSIPYDPHLTCEAANYQEFPDHFFQHWNGYNLIKPICSPVPLHALVPQFYGYYVPVEEVALSDKNTMNVDKEKATTRKPYLSPILLLEHCGQPINPSTLSEDDREECASLFLRFNDAGWLHESIFERNVLVQRGLPTQWPIQRDNSIGEMEPQNSFRLIDFGRSRKISDPVDWEMLRLGAGETADAMKLVKVSRGAFV